MRIKEKMIFDEPVCRGLKYLFDHQFPNGEFASYVSGDAAMKGWIRPDANIFTTALICHSLQYILSDLSEEIQSKSLAFLGGQMEKGGLWNYFSRYHRYRNVIPNDLDDTCFISALYRDKKIDFPNPSNKNLILSNRDSKGLYYTWFKFRLKQLKYYSYRSYIFYNLIGTIQSLFYSKIYATVLKDNFDAVVNANVLYYLGEIPETLPIIENMITIINSEKEGDCDLWYRDPIAVYYFFSRNYNRGIKKLEPIKTPIIIRILSNVNLDGSIGKSILETALALCSLINLGHSCIEMSNARNYLISTQAKEGNWPRWSVFYIGPKKLLGWGSEELTTAFCIEAISRYNEF